MSSKGLPFMICALALTMVGASGCSSDTADEHDDEPGNTEDPLTAPAASGPIKFTDACRAGTTITIAAVGDVLLHSPLQKQAYAASNGHHSLVEERRAPPRASGPHVREPGRALRRRDYDERGDEGSGQVFDDRVYSSYPQFNYHPSLITALLETGIDVVSTANNHAMDRRSLGADKTIDNLRAAKLPFTGTRRSNEPDAELYTIREAKGVRVAFVACSFSTNGLPDPKNQVLSCYEDKATLLSTIKSLAHRPEDVDAVIVTPHWGIEYQHKPQQQERNLAHEMLEAGALVVLGNHPHVTQGMETYHHLGLSRSIRHLLARQLRQRPDRPAEAVVRNPLRGPHEGRRRQGDPQWGAPSADHDGLLTVDRAAGHGESLALTTKLLGEWNRIAPDEPLVTNPECAAGR